MVSLDRSIFKQTESYKLCTLSPGRTLSEIRLPVSASRIRQRVVLSTVVVVLMVAATAFVLMIVVVFVVGSRISTVDIFQLMVFYESMSKIQNIEAELIKSTFDRRLH